MSSTRPLITVFLNAHSRIILDRMTVNELLLVFRANNVPEHYYVVDGVGGGECYGIGVIDLKWSIYYSERGKRSVLRQFDSEAAACQELFNYIETLMLEDFGRSIDQSKS